MKRLIRAIAAASAAVGLGYIVTHDVLPPWLLISGVFGIYCGGVVWSFWK